MDSEELLRVLDKAISEKEKARRNYETYIQGITNKSIKKVVQGVLEREEGHLDFLNTFRDSVRRQGNADAAALSAADLLKRFSANPQQLDLLKTVIEGIEENKGLENHNADQVEFYEEEFQQGPIPEQIAEAPERHQTGPGLGFVRSSSRQNRSVVSCRFNNSSRAVMKKNH